MIDGGSICLSVCLSVCLSIYLSTILISYITIADPIWAYLCPTYLSTLNPTRWWSCLVSHALLNTNIYSKAEPRTDNYGCYCWVKFLITSSQNCQVAFIRWGPAHRWCFYQNLSHGEWLVHECAQRGCTVARITPSCQSKVFGADFR